MQVWKQIQNRQFSVKKGFKRISLNQNRRAATCETGTTRESFGVRANVWLSSHETEPLFDKCILHHMFLKPDPFIGSASWHEGRKKLYLSLT